MDLNNNDQRITNIQWGGIADSVVWRQIPAWPGYEVSTSGLIRLAKTKAPRNPALSGNGRLCIHLSQIKAPRTIERKTLYVHRLVAEVFLLNKKNLPHVAHLDGNCRNNHVFNLRWVTHIENMSHKVQHGTNSKKLCERAIVAIRALSSDFGFSDAKLAKLFRMSHGAIHGITKKKIWRHVA